MNFEYKNRKNRGVRVTAFTLVLMLLLSFTLSSCNSNQSQGNTTVSPPVSLPTDNSETEEELLSVFYLDVGQGDGTLLRSPEGEYMMIDCGKNKGANLLVETMKICGVETIEYLILTHPHEDHIGGADDVLENFEVKNVIYPDVSASSKSWRDVEAAMAKEEEEGCNLIIAAPGATYTFSDETFEIIAPMEIIPTDLNNCSVAIRYEYKENYFIFTGDAEKESEYRMVETFGPVGKLKADVLKLGHHGSRTSSTESFLKAVSPKIGIISCGKDNDYGHPHRETIEKMKKYQIEYYSTAEYGNIVIQSDGKNLMVNKVPYEELIEFVNKQVLAK